MESRKKAQGFFHRFDRYANPVTLTYNQQRSFKTVPGGICSVITFLVLTYYIVVTVLTHTLSVSYVTTSSTQLLTEDYTTFTISTDKLQVYSMLYSANDIIANNIDAYVGGVYL